ncbi:F-box/kelch-repeat protein At3g23880-like [Silene latifolia]|uniref:F-box/kelch-repeat protein At3g23880-like n=1 Tax=Silene latifolia TaxID=37657 RepID=UPI003D77A74F
METMEESSKNHTASSNLWNISEFNYLPPEVWTQILLSLPAKTLLKFRLQGLLDERWLLTVREAETLRSTDLIFRKSDSYRYRISSSCNGLLLVEVGQYGPHGYQEDLKLWNPCIRKSLLLPTCPLSLSFFTTMYLLGFSPDSKDYKVVAFAFEISDDILPGKLHSAVYTLRDQLWTVGNPITTCMRNPYSLLTAVFFRGATYWLAENDYQRNEPTHLGSFDFDKENIDFLELPFTLDATRFYRFLFLLGGSLAVFSISKVTSSIWVLEQGNEKGPWTLVFREINSGCLSLVLQRLMFLSKGVLL